MKNDITTLLFDMDDTLILTIEKFIHYKNMIGEKLSKEMQKEKETILNEFDSLDKENVKKLGLSPTRFITSWNDYMLINKVSDELANEINNDLEKMFNEPYEKIEKVDIVLDYLIKKYDLILVTAGHYETQMKKIKENNFNDYFSTIYIPELKTEQDYLDILKKEKLHASEVIMIGNSLTSDINPATNVGINGIHIDKKTWSYDESIVNNKYTTIESIEKLLEIL